MEPGIGSGRRASLHDSEGSIQPFHARSIAKRYKDPSRVARQVKYIIAPIREQKYGQLSNELLFNADLNDDRLVPRAIYQKAIGDRTITYGAHSSMTAKKKKEVGTSCYNITLAKMHDMNNAFSNTIYWLHSTRI